MIYYHSLILHHKALAFFSFEVFKQLSFLLCGFDHNIPFLLFENSFEKSCFRVRLQETLCHNSLRKAVVPVTLFELL